MKHKQKMYEPTISDHGEKQEAVNNSVSSSTKDEPLIRTRRERRPQANSDNFRVEIPEFEGKLDPDKFLEWTNMVKRIFEYKEVLKDKKVKLVALRLRKYASFWWTKLRAERVRNRKSKIRTWEKIKAKLKSLFLPPIYTQDRYSQLYNLTQGSLNIREFDYDQM